MSSGVYSSTSLNLSDRVTLNAISNDNLDFEGNSGADVNVTGLASVQLEGSTSGSFQQQAAGTTTTYTVTWPNAQSGVTQLLENDGSGNLSWVDHGSSGAGGSTNDIQFNNAGALDGDSELTWNTSTKLMSLDGGFTQTNTQNPTVVNTITDATNLPNAAFMDFYGSILVISNVGSSDKISFFDISDPTNPELLSFYEDSAVVDNPRNTQIQGNYVFTVGGTNGNFVVFDMKNPTSPTVAGQLTLASGCSRLIVTGIYAYVACDAATDFIQIVDISDPTTPVTKGSITNSDFESIRAIDIKGNYLYVVSVDEHISIIDVSDSDSPVVVGTFTDVTNVNGIQHIIVDGKYMYLCCQGSNSFVILDISDPSSMSITGILTDGTNLNSQDPFAKSGDYVYIPNANLNTIYVLDVSDPTSPVIQGSLADGTNLNIVNNVVLVGRYLYAITTSSNILTVLDISGTKLTAVEAGNLKTDTVNVTRDSNFVGPASFSSGVQINNSLGILSDLGVNGSSNLIGNLDVEGDITKDSVVISTQSNPELLGSLIDATNLNGAQRIIVSNDGNTAYVISEPGDSFAVLDVSDPSSISVTGVVIDSVQLNGPNDMVIVGTNAYIACRNSNSLTVVDFSTPASPSVIGFFQDNTNLDNVIGIDISGTNAYMVTILDRFTVVDITTPSTPSLVTSILDNTDLNQGLSVKVSGNYAFVVASANNSLTVVDITTPATPSVVTTVTDASIDNPRYVYLEGVYAYLVSSNTDALTIIDITTPTTPSVSGSVSEAVILNALVSVYVSGNFAYVTGTDYVSIIDVEDKTNPFIVGSYVNASILDAPESIQLVNDKLYVVATTSDSIAVLSTTSTSGIKIDGSLQVNDPLVLAQGLTSVTSDIEFNSKNITGVTDYVGSGSISGITTLSASGNVSSGATVSGVNGDFSSLVQDSIPYISNGDGRLATDTDLGWNNSSNIMSVNGAFSQSANSTPITSVGVQVGSLADASAVKVYGNYAYVQDGTGLRVINVSDPANTSTVTTLTGVGTSGSLSGGPIYMKVQGDYLFKSGNNASFYVINISDPNNPSIAGSLGGFTNTRGVDVVGKYAYLTSDDTLTVIDISDPTNPTSVGSLVDATDLTTPYQLSVRNNIAYIPNLTGGTGNGKLVVVDVSDPTSPLKLTTIDNDTDIANARQCQAVGNILYVLGSANEKIVSYDITDPSDPTKLSSVGSGNLLMYFVVTSNYIYYTSLNDDTVRRLDISDPTNLSNAGNYDPNDTNVLNGPRGIDTNGKYLFVACSDTGAGQVGSLNVLDPSGVTLTSTIADNIQTFDLSVSNESHFLGPVSMQNGLQVNKSLAVLSDLTVNGDVSFIGPLELKGTTSGTIDFQAAATTTSYSVTWPNAQASGTQVLQNDGSGNLSWATDSGSGITTLNTLTDASQTFATGTSGTDFNISSASGTHTFNIPNAGLSARGLVSTGAQSYSGTKTFQTIVATGTVTLQSANTSSKFRVRDSSSNDILNVDTTNTAPTSSDFQNVTVYASKTNSGLTIQTNDNTTTQGLNFQNSGTFYTSRIERVDEDGTEASLVFKCGPASADVTSLSNRLSINSSGQVSVLTNTASTSNSTGALVVTGGAGIGGAVYAGGSVSATTSFLFQGSTSGTLTMSVPASVTSYSLTYPNVQGALNEVLQNDGSGNLSWVPGPRMAFTAESNSALGATNALSWGNGLSSLSSGPAMAFAGTIRRLTIRCTSSSTCTMTLYINGSSSGASVSLSAAQTGTSTISQSVSINDYINLVITSGTANQPVGTAYVILDV